MKGEITRQVFDEKMDALREYCSLPEVQARSLCDYTVGVYRGVVNLGPEALKYLRGLIGKKGEPRKYVLAACCDILGSIDPDLRPHFPTETIGKLGKKEGLMRMFIDDFTNSSSRKF